MIANGLAVHARLAPSWFQQRGQNFNRGGLARAVGADESKTLAGLNGQIQIVQSDQVAIFFREVDSFNHRHGQLRVREVAAKRWPRHLAGE